MDKLVLATRNFLREEEGVTIIEYALIAALIALGVVVTVLLVQTELKALFTKISKCLADKTGAACTAD